MAPGTAEWLVRLFTKVEKHRVKQVWGKIMHSGIDTQDFRLGMKNIKGVPWWSRVGIPCFHCWGPRFDPWLGN